MEEKIDKKSRIEYLDIARGIAIILMVAGHVFYYDIYWEVIFSFHMPIFVIISGMFFKYTESFKEYILKMIKKLFVPYVIGVCIVSTARNLIVGENISIIPQVLLGYSNFKSLFYNTESVGALWFVPYLIVIKIMYYVVYKELQISDKFLTIECLIILIVGLCFKNNEIYLPWSIDIALATMIFYHIGYLIKKYNILEKWMNDYKIMLIFLVVWIIGIKYTDLELAVRIYSIPAFITAFCGSMVLIKVSHFIQKHIKLIGKFLMWCGKNTIIILIAHYYEYKVFEYEGTDLEIFAKKIAFVIIVAVLVNIIKILFEKISEKYNLDNIFKNKQREVEKLEKKLQQ